MNEGCRFAVIVAGGHGTRMQNDVPKQFIEILGKPVLVHTIESFLKAEVDVLILVLAKEYFKRWQSIKEKWLPNYSIRLVEGADSRFQSVRNGLKGVDGTGMVAIHDAARPCVSARLINSSFKAASVYKSAVAAVALKDSIREKSGSTTISRDRSNYYLVQTPQTFDNKLLKNCKPYNNHFTDDASVVSSDGHEVHLIEGLMKILRLPQTAIFTWLNFFI